MPGRHASTATGGGIDLEDFAAAAEYLRSLDWVDPARVAVYGGSYGGFAALSCVSRLPDLWAAGVSVCGPANLETLARSMPPDGITVVREMFGDPDTDADDMRRRSPVTYADQIKATLLVIQGANTRRCRKPSRTRLSSGCGCGRAASRCRTSAAAEQDPARSTANPRTGSPQEG
jgi:dipeptidyl aminopeptidase/acylaminoacyl peptidase